VESGKERERCMGHWVQLSANMVLNVMDTFLAARMLITRYTFAAFRSQACFGWPFG